MMLPIPGFEAYCVTDSGRVWSTKTDRWMKAHPNPKSGHMELTLQRDGKAHTKKVHALVMLAFVGPRPDGLQVRHLNGTPSDNDLDNLAYGTNSDNVQDSLRHGTHAQASKVRCDNDHEFTPENTYIRPGSGGRHRQCRTCKRETWRRLRAK